MVRQLQRDNHCGCPFFIGAKKDLFMECPFCKEEIKDGAKKCRYCGEFFEDYQDEKIAVAECQKCHKIKPKTKMNEQKEEVLIGSTDRKQDESTLLYWSGGGRADADTYEIQSIWVCHDCLRSQQAILNRKDRRIKWLFMVPLLLALSAFFPPVGIPLLIWCVFWW